eukprot:2986483-Pyramimonas_sp.AAC.1
MDDLEKMIPLFVHGDKVEYSNEDSLMVWHMGSVLSTDSSLYAGLLLGATPHKTEVKSTAT